MRLGMQCCNFPKEFRLVPLTVCLVALVSIPPSSQAENNAPSVTLRRCKVHESKVYTFDFEDPLEKGSPVFAVLSEPRQGNDNPSEVGRYHVFGVGMVNNNADTLRWDVTPGYLFASTVQGRPGLHVGAGLGRYPIEALRENLDFRDSLDRSHPKAQPFYPDRPWVWRPPGFYGLEPVSQTLMRFKWDPERVHSSSHGWGPDFSESANHIPVVEYDIRAIDDWTVELLMTTDGRPSLWRLEASEDVARHEWRWNRVAEYASTIGGPFLWMRDPKYVVAERDGNWCVIGPIDAEEPQARPIVAKEAEVPLYLVEDVHIGKDYFRSGGKLLDEQGRAVGTIDLSKSPDDQLREVISQVISRRP
jgi:hypothetical protein